MREWCSPESRGRAKTETDVRIVPRALGAELVGSARVTLPPRGDTMVLTNDDDPVATTTAVVTIRIPCGADGDLVTDAEKRLSQAAGTAEVTIDELYSIEPKLSATVVTVGATMEFDLPLTDTEARERLAVVPGLESIDHIR